jgi:hypothetical protein
MPGGAGHASVPRRCFGVRPEVGILVAVLLALQAARIPLEGSVATSLGSACTWQIIALLPPSWRPHPPEWPGNAPTDAELTGSFTVFRRRPHKRSDHGQPFDDQPGQWTSVSALAVPTLMAIHGRQWEDRGDAMGPSLRPRWRSRL